MDKYVRAIVMYPEQFLKRRMRISRELKALHKVKIYWVVLAAIVNNKCGQLILDLTVMGERQIGVVGL